MPVSGQVDEAFFAGFQLGELLGQVGVEFLNEPLLVVQDGFQLLTGGHCEVCWHSQLRVVTGDASST
jgi:hypothetical protein